MSKFFYRLTFLIFNSSIPPSASIEEGTIFAYGGIGVVLHSHCRIGANCMIGQGVTIGGNFNSPGKAPIIGNNCYISTGAKILGNVTIGDNCVVGANAVVVHDVPACCVVAGVPAKIIKENIDIKNYWSRK